jgi:hypothetical protein
MADLKPFRAILVPWNPFNPMQEITLSDRMATRLDEIKFHLDGPCEVVAGTSTLNKLMRGSARVGMLVNDDVNTSRTRSGVPLVHCLNARASYIATANIRGNALLVGLGREDVLPMPDHTTLAWLTEQLAMIVEP